MSHIDAIGTQFSDDATALIESLDNLSVSASNEFLQKTSATTIANIEALSSISWGDITGTFANQTDLQAALDLKADITDLHSAVTLAGTPDYLTLSDQQITLTKLDISDDTNFVAGSHLTLSTNTVDVDDDFLLNNGDIGTGMYDFGGATSFEIPNSATPTVDAAGEIAIDTTITDHTGLITYHDGVETLYVISIPTGNLVTTDGYVIAYNATNNEFEMVAQSASAAQSIGRLYAHMGS